MTPLDVLDALSTGALVAALGLIAVLGVLTHLRLRRELLGAAPPAWLVGDRAGPAASRHRANLAAVRAAGDARMDVVVYGDSITSIVAQKAAKKSAWLPGYFKRLRVSFLGVPGDGVGDLHWRIAEGGEKFATDPRAVVLWIGTNDVGRGGDPAEGLRALVEHVRAAMPTSRVVVAGMLPSTRYDTAPGNARFEAVARDTGASFANCGAGMDPAGGQFLDGLHLSNQGYDVALACLARAARAALKK